MSGLKSVISGVEPDVDVPIIEGDYGSEWATVPLPTIQINVPCFLIAHNTNGSDSWRLYIHDGTVWKSAALT